MKSIVVLISGNGSNLQSIIDQCLAEKINGKVTAVISNKADAYGLTRAADASIPSHVVDNKAFSDRESYDQALKNCIEQYQPDLVVLAGFMRILTPEFVRFYQGKMLNIHPSLLPKYKGLHTHQRAIDDGESEHGASVHFVTPDLDGGPVILQSKVPVFEDDTEKDLAARVQQQELTMYPMVVSWFCNERLSMQADKALMDGKPLGQQGYATE